MSIEDDLDALFKVGRDGEPEELRAEIQRFTGRHGQSGVARVALLTLPHIRSRPDVRQVVLEELERMGIDPAETERW